MHATSATGAHRGEGRTLTVANLAIAFAESGCRVAVVEADLRNPRMGDYFGFAYEPGLAEVLAGSKDVSGVLRTWRDQVDIVFAGRGRADPGHLIASSRLLTVFDELKKDHDLILVDAPASTAPSTAPRRAARAALPPWRRSRSGRRRCCTPPC